jgi:3-oxoacyl-[acyl-carrier protein] reductase
MSGRVALVTGASRGIGAAVAATLRRDAFEVLTPARGELDLMSDDSIDAYLASLRGPVDVLVNNAGVNFLSGVAELDDEDLRATVQVNLLAQIRLIKGLAARMVEARYGRIVNVSSIWSLASKPRRLAYSTTKAAVNGLTRALAVELAPYNVLVNAVAPGYVNTELTKQNNSEEALEQIRQAIPQQRLAEPEEIAEVVAFLCSEKNTYITGQVIVADGGFLCQ